MGDRLGASRLGVLQCGSGRVLSHISVQRQRTGEDGESAPVAGVGDGGRRSGRRSWVADPALQRQVVRI